MTQVTPSLEIQHVTRLDHDASAAVAALVSRATRTDGTGPIDDQVRSELAYGSATESSHLLARIGGDVVGYAHVAVDPSTANAHLVIDPPQRLRGYGGDLLDHLLAIADGGADGVPSVGPAQRGSRRQLLVWAHGDTEGARALATSRSFARVRDLWQMQRDLSLPLPDPAYPDDVSVRTFRPGPDDAAWVALNAAAFARHPEQGRLTVEDLRHRIAEDWFDAAGFFVAERAGALVGSHWTKVHPAEDNAPAIGEVYAVGVHPDAQGLGLGKALTLTGLHHLRDAGLGEVMLYVDGDNAAAVRLYEALDFERSAVDVMYASP